MEEYILTWSGQPLNEGLIIAAPNKNAARIIANEILIEWEKLDNLNASEQNEYLEILWKSEYELTHAPIPENELYKKEDDEPDLEM